jgi:hypothetical protein
MPWEREKKQEKEGENEVELGIDPVAWDGVDVKSALLMLYEHETRFARLKVQWYFDDAQRSGRYATAYRHFAIVLGTVGTLCPLVDAARLFENLRLGAWGYVLLAIAVGVLSLDRFGGTSWRWTKSTLIWVALRRELALFQHDWIWLMSNANEGSASPSERFARLRSFRRDIEVIIAQECNDWASMTDQARRDLELSLQRDQIGSRSATAEPRPDGYLGSSLSTAGEIRSPRG